VTEKAPNPDEQVEAQQLDSEAVVAERQQGDGNSEYKDHHPDAITDRDKAEYMAYASKEREENVARHTGLAKKLMDKVDGRSLQDVQKQEQVSHHIHNANIELRRARRERKAADFLASEAGRTYDEVIKPVYDEIRELRGQTESSHTSNVQPLDSE